MLLYTAQQIRQQEQLWSEQTNQPTYALMQRAGRAALLHIKHHFAEVNSMCIVCGCGNNAGDGYQLAAEAIDEGLQVRLLQVGKPPKQDSDAALAMALFEQRGAKVIDFGSKHLEQCDLIVDGLLGSGIQGAVREPFIQAIESINNAAKPVLALDIPSGLNADSGEIGGVSVQADHTLCFVGAKRGMLTADGKDVCGQIFINDLGVNIENKLQQAAPQTQSWLALQTQLIPRKHNRHKGSFGRALCIGGGQHMGGAITLSTQSALRAGAGYVFSFCHPQHIGVLNSQCPEAIVQTDFSWLSSNIEQMDAILIGPGLGQDAWAQRALTLVLTSNKPLVLDADALNLIAELSLDLPANSVITPHPGEAKRLLAGQWPIGDRYCQINALANKFTRSAILLKGAGSLITDGNNTYVETGGNPGMASAGMGDVLAGIIVALMAQGYQPLMALRLAVGLHAYTADQLAQSGQWGLLASDVAMAIRQYLP